MVIYAQYIIKKAADRSTAPILYNYYKSKTFLLSNEDSNLDKQNQNLLCYHYTIRQ